MRVTSFSIWPIERLEVERKNRPPLLTAIELSLESFLFLSLLIYCWIINSLFGAETLQRRFRKHLPQHTHEIALGKSACAIAQHRHRARGFGVSEEPLYLVKQRDRLRARVHVVLRRTIAVGRRRGRRLICTTGRGRGSLDEFRELANRQF